MDSAAGCVGVAREVAVCIDKIGLNCRIQVVSGYLLRLFEWSIGLSTGAAPSHLHRVGRKGANDYVALKSSSF